ncbi:class I SAM-dependent methyltransferase [Hydrogenophaga sp.]|uniref:class I SAM-dependent methyltransferase n=1 Tax=Hydrogenophaga sp. TaxID=1904254 RepID=UPI00286E69F4|nr:class I SAM-dependent methyltransferase [Hydrogenophaga sp.]
MVTAPPPVHGSDTSAPEAMLALYRARAADYDDELRPFEPLREAAIERLQLQTGQTVLDVGCGTGLSFAPLLQRLGPRGRIVGIEPCPDMLAHARARLGPAQRPQVKLVQASAQAARWRGQADAALLHFTHDIVRHPAALDQVFAHLKPGARVVATGLQWAPPWAVSVNAFVLGAALYSISSLEGLDRPWSGLEDRLDGFEVTPEWMGGVYIASGTVPDTDPRNAAP